jgi:hypothetical protein
MRTKSDVRRYRGRGAGSAQRELLEALLARTADDLGRDPNVDARNRVDLVSQILRHARGKCGGPYDQSDPPGIPAEVDGRLPGRVPAADHVHLTTREPLPLGRRRAVEHADTVEVLEVGDVETAVD